MGKMKSFGMALKKTLMAGVAGFVVLATASCSGPIENQKTEVRTEVDNDKKITSAAWMNADFSQALENAGSTDSVGILIGTKGYKEGEEISVTIDEVDGEEKAVVLKGKVQADGFARILFDLAEKKGSPRDLLTGGDEVSRFTHKTVRPPQPGQEKTRNVSIPSSAG
ncbi:hypothetical protein [Polaromonas sp. UC242_47]|uniref:hypothetical protein n=1 Tax=Polaromonas sp. UC242_47 TaxID=3374626 RepID=UPI0037A4A9C3